MEMEAAAGGAGPSRGAAGAAPASSSAYLSRPTGTRWIPTADQIRILRDLYYNGGIRSPNAEQIQRICVALRRYGKVEGKNVFYWFQNHKARERQKRRLSVDVSAAPAVAGGASSSSSSSSAALSPAAGVLSPATAAPPSADLLYGAGSLLEAYPHGAGAAAAFSPRGFVEHDFMGRGRGRGAVDVEQQSQALAAAAGFRRLGFASPPPAMAPAYYYAPPPMMPLETMSPTTREMVTLPLFPVSNATPHNLPQLQAQGGGGGFMCGGGGAGDASLVHGASLELTLGSYACYPPPGPMRS